MVGGGIALKMSYPCGSNIFSHQVLAKVDTCHHYQTNPRPRYIYNHYKIHKPHP